MTTGVSTSGGHPVDPAAVSGRYRDAAVWVLMAGGAGMAAFASAGIAPVWAGFFAGALPAYLLSAVVIAARG